MLALLVPGVGMGGGASTPVLPPPLVEDAIDFGYTQEDAIDFSYTQRDTVDFDG